MKNSTGARAHQTRQRKQGIRAERIVDSFCYTGSAEELVAAGHCTAEQIPLKPGSRAYVKIAEDGSYVGMRQDRRCFVYLYKEEWRRRTEAEFAGFMARTLANKPFSPDLYARDRNGADGALALARHVLAAEIWWTSLSDEERLLAHGSMAERLGRAV